MLYSVNNSELAQLSADQSSKIWHERLDHLNNGYISQMMKKEIVNGVNRNIRETGNDCEGCSRAKMHRNPCPKVSQSRDKKPYGMAHSNDCSPMQIEPKLGIGT